MKLSAYVALIVLVLFSSCSDEEEVHYYKFKDIQYSMEEGDGIARYDTPMEIITVTKNSSVKDEMFSPQVDPYVKNHERYVFTCDSSEDFNPTEGYVHVPVPLSIAGNEIVISSDLKEYSMTETDDMKYMEWLPAVVVPPMTKLTLSGELTIEKLTLTYIAVFVCCISGEEYVVKGKYIRYCPCELRVNKKFEELN